jgi:hypothetical protein
MWGRRPTRAWPANPNSKVRRHSARRCTSYSRATLSGAALTERAPPCRRVSMCCATSSGAAPSSAAPPCMALQKGLALWIFFADGLFFKFVSSLGYFCLNRPR